MSTAQTVMLLTLLLFPMQAEVVQAQSGQYSNASVITIDVPVEEVLRGYLSWIHTHPEAKRSMEWPDARVFEGTPNSSTESTSKTRQSNNGSLQEGQSNDSQPSQGSNALIITTPSIDLYSKLGASLYHGTSSNKNAELIKALPHSFPQNKVTQTSEVRPTLQEAVEMFAELKPYKMAILTTKEPMVFALTYPERETCKMQNAAIQQLKNRANRIGIRVIEVRLHR